LKNGTAKAVYNRCTNDEVTGDVRGGVYRDMDNEMLLFSNDNPILIVHNQ
jgi:hypothetical protein